MTVERCIHASCVSYDGMGVLITGDSGTGKSSMAAGLMSHGALLVSDDQVVLSVYRNQLFARAPETIKGKMELYGLGVIGLKSGVMEQAPIGVLFHCAPLIMPERMPDVAHKLLLDVPVPYYEIDPFHAYSLAKVRLLVQSMASGSRKTLNKAAG